nr:penicillin acylase family protein [Phenylobacterium sp.]
MRGLFAALAVIIGLAATPALADIPPGAVREQQAITGLEKPAQILVDQWGVPHIYAASERDAFFLQGWNAARDRLWQIDLWRKRGLGRLAASFGPAYVAQDRAARLFVYRGDMAAEWAAYGPSAKGRAEAFTAGVNAYVAAVLKGEAPLPVEFTLTGSKPELWEAADIVRIRSHALTRNADSEVARARVTCLAGLGADTLRRNLDPPWTTSVPAGLDPCAIPADVLENYVLATREVSFEALARRAPIPPVSAAPSAEDYALLTQRIENEGSNNWVVAPSRTATGRPLLANDPHRALGAPSLRYLVQLEAPGLSVIGAGEPSLPGVSLGHNARIAFGFTIFPVDQEDLYVYALNPANPLQYRYRGRWEPMRTVTETIEVKGEAPREITLAFTRHGPVIRTDDKGQAFALRTVWSEPGTNAYFG